MSNEVGRLRLPLRYEQASLKAKRPQSEFMSDPKPRCSILYYNLSRIC
jgi:hypothetical protein